MASADCCRSGEERTVHPRVGMWVGAVGSCVVAVRPRKDEANSVFARPSLDLRGSPYVESLATRGTEGPGSEVLLLRAASIR